MRNLLGVSVALLAIMGTANDRLWAQKVESQVTKAEQSLDVKAFRQAVFAKRSLVVVVSHNGVYEGKDDDLELILRRDGSAKITNYGYGVTSSNGKYEVTKDGMIIVKPNGESEWEPMPWTIENDMLVIRPPSKQVLFDLARKAGVPEAELTDKAYQESYEQWPLRETTVRRSQISKP